MIDTIKLFLSGLPLAKIKLFATIGLVVAVVVLYLLWQGEKTAHKLTISETKALGEIQKAENKAKIEAQKHITDNVIKSYETQVKEVHQYYEANPNLRYITINRLPVNTSGSGMSTESESTTSTNAGYNGVEETTTTTIDLEKAGQEIVQCLKLIEFTKQQDAVD